MNTPFQDTKIDQQNIQLYQDIPEEEFTKNVNPEAQKLILKIKRKALKSLSPDKSPYSFDNLANFNTSQLKLPKSQAFITINSSKSTLLPQISNTSSTLNCIDMKSRQTFVAENCKQQSFLSQFQSSKSEYQSDSNLRRKTQTKTIFQEDKMEQDRALKLSYLKNKYDQSLKNTFCLRNKSSQMRSMREISSKQISPIRTNAHLNDKSATQFDHNNIKNILGIFVQKKKDDQEQSKLFLRHAQSQKTLPSPLISTYKYDKIYKMFVEQQILQAQKDAEKNEQNQPNQFSFDPNQVKRKRVVKSDFRIKTLGNQNELVDYIDSKRSLENEYSNQLSPIQQMSHMSYEQAQKQPYISLQQPNSNKFFPSTFKSKKDYLQFINNPLSLQGSNIQTSPGISQNGQQQAQTKNIFSNNAIKQIFNYSPSKSPQKLNSFISSGKMSNASIKDTSSDDMQSNMSQELIKKSSFSLQLQQKHSQQHKPFGSLTQSSFKRNPSGVIDMMNNGEESDNNIQNRRKLTQTKSNKSQHDILSKFGSQDFDDDEICSPVIDVHMALNNLNNLKLNEDSVLEADNPQQKLIFLKKINDKNGESEKPKSKKQVDFQISETKKYKTSKDLNSEENSKSENLSKQVQSLNQLKSEENGYDSEDSEDYDSGDIDVHSSQKRALKNQPSISLKVDQQNFESESEEAADSHGFVLKRTIDFAQLKELRDKTINRLNGNQIVNRRSSNSLTLKRENKNKFHPLVSPAQFKQGKQVFDFNSDGNPNSHRSTEKEIKEDSKKKISIRQYFRNGNGKKKGKGKKKMQEQQTQEEKQKQQDIKIAEKLDGLKDKLRMGVKIVIRQQIQKKIQSTLSTQILNNLKLDEAAIDDSNQFNEFQQYEDKQIDNPFSLESPINAFQDQSMLSGLKQKQASNKTKIVSPSSSKDNSSKPSFHNKQNSSLNEKNSNKPSLQIQVNQNNSKKSSVHSSVSPKGEGANGQQKQVGLSKYSNNNQSNLNPQKNTQLSSPNKKTQNPTYDEQQKEVQQYSQAIMSFFNACVDNMKNNTTLISHDFQLKNLKNFNQQFSQSLVESFAQEMKNQKMSSQDVERFRYIYEINTKMHIFYKGIVQLLGGIHKLQELIQQIIKKISSHLTILSVNHEFSPEQMYRRIIPGICALLCEDHKLFYQTLKIFMATNKEDEFSFIDFYFIKKYIYSFLTKQKKNEISQQLCLLIMQKIESVRRFVFPITVLSDLKLRDSVAQKLFECEKFMELFSPQFQLKHLKIIIYRLYDYFYYEGEDQLILDFKTIKKVIEPFVKGKVSRKIFDYIEQFTQKALQEDPFTLNVILRDLHYKFTKVRLRFGYSQGIFGIIKFNEIPQLIESLKEEIDHSVEYGLLAELSEVEQQKVKDTSFIHKYLRFLLCEYDIFSVYDTSVSMSYLGVTVKYFKFWLNCLHSVMLTRYNLQPSKVQIFMRFVEACCPAV
ncbi:hypothetical protein ABPG74_020541 [Tetrahymena malaccensis]